MPFTWTCSLPKGGEHAGYFSCLDSAGLPRAASADRIPPARPAHPAQPIRGDVGVRLVSLVPVNAGPRRAVLSNVTPVAHLPVPLDVAAVLEAGTERPLCRLPLPASLAPATLRVVTPEPHVDRAVALR